MSTIIIPGGGGVGLGIASLAGNIVALVLLIAIVKYFWAKVEFPAKPINVTSELMKYNIDATGLFASSPSPQKENYTSIDAFMRPALV